MGIFTDGSCRTSEVSAQYVCLYGKDGAAIPYPPLPINQESRDAPGMLGIVEMSTFKLDDAIKDPREFKFPMLRSDGSRVNESVLVTFHRWGMGVIGNLFILGFVYVVRTISLLRQWPLGGFTFGSFLMTSRVIDYRRLPNFKNSTLEIRRRR